MLACAYTCTKVLKFHMILKNSNDNLQSYSVQCMWSYCTVYNVCGPTVQCTKYVVLQYSVQCIRSHITRYPKITCHQVPQDHTSPGTQRSHITRSHITRYPKITYHKITYHKITYHKITYHKITYHQVSQYHISPGGTPRSHIKIIYHQVPKIAYHQVPQDHISHNHQVPQDHISSALHKAPFIYGKVHFGVLNMLHASIATSHIPRSSNSPKHSAGILKLLLSCWTVLFVNFYIIRCRNTVEQTTLHIFPLDLRQ